MSLRDQFVAEFGEPAAVALEKACDGHMAEAGSLHANDDRGSEPFRYVLLACIGYQCLVIERFRQHHDIRPSKESLQSWIVENAKLEEHVGDLPDYLAMVVGAFNPWLSIDTQLEMEQKRAMAEARRADEQEEDDGLG